MTVSRPSHTRPCPSLAAIQVLRTSPVRPGVSSPPPTRPSPARWPKETGKAADELTEALDAFYERSIRPEFERMDGHLGQMDGRLDRMDGRLGQVEGSLARLEGRVDRLAPLRQVRES